MIVVKLGGSLSESDALLNCLNTIEQRFRGRAVVIVPGGGRFADQVRESQKRWRFNDNTAHHMALLAMQQMALLCHGLKNDFQIAHSMAAVQSRLNENNIAIWSPDIRELDLAGIPATWDITSDSLAAWLAAALSATKLIVVKSATIDNQFSNQQLIKNRIVDRAFFDFVSKASFKLHLLDKDSFFKGDYTG